MPASRSELLRRAKGIKLFAVDVDGVLTDGDVIVLKSGEEVKLWSSKDRLLFALLRESKSPLITAWITGRQSENVARTAEELGINHVVQRCSDKKAALMHILKKHKLTFEDALFMGDDLVDLSALKSVGFSACPADAVPDVKKTVHYISPYNGGRGTVRDVLEFILRAQNKWNPLIKSFYS